MTLLACFRIKLVHWHNIALPIDANYCKLKTLVNGSGFVNSPKYHVTILLYAL